MKKRSVLALFIIFVMLILFVSLTIVSALSFNDFSDFFKNFWGKITGRATENLPPVATLSATPLSGEAPLTVSFEVYCSDPDNNLAVCHLSFRDNSGATFVSDTGLPVSEQMQNIYQEGTYIVKLTAMDASGLRDEVQTTITVSKASPTPTPSASPSASPGASPSPTPTPQALCSGPLKPNFLKKETCADKSGRYSDYCSSPAQLIEYYCKNNTCTKSIKNCSENNMICSKSAGVCVGETVAEKLNGYLQVATIKDTYNVGEKVELTDPPEETSSENILTTSNQKSYISGAVVIDNRLSEDVSSISQPLERHIKEENQIYNRINKQTEIPKEVQERIAKLDSAAISELVESRKKVSEEKNTLKKYEEAYTNTEIRGLNVINPFAYIKRSQAKGAVELQDTKVEEADSNLKAKLDKHGVPEEINRRLDEIEEKATTWTPNYNKILLQTDEYKEKLCGIKLSEEEAKELSAEKTEMISSITPESDSSLPAFFDWRAQHGENYITPVKDQLSCGSCWAFASVAALEGAINAYYNNPNIDADLSEQDLITCYQDDGCEGAYDYEIEALFRTYLKEAGIPKEECFVYEACDEIEFYGDMDHCTYTVECDKKCSDWQADAWKIVSYKAPELTIEAIKKIIMENGPVVVGMIVYDDFPGYIEGIYQHTSEHRLGGHAVTIVGWNKSDGMDYWIVKNSWGDWGEKGYFKIFAGECEIDSRFAFAIEQPVAPYDEKRICQDKDGDSYCNWGLGEKPSTCPTNCKEIKDCDDSDSRIFEGCGKSTEKTGFLTVNSEPESANVYVFNEEVGDYVYRGETPLTFELNVGEREINITKEDYLDKLIKVDVAEEPIIELSVKLNLAPKLIYPLNNDIFRAGDIIEINGTAPPGPEFKNYIIEYGKGENPEKWFTNGITLVNYGKIPLIENKLATWDTSSIKESGFYTIKLSVDYGGGIIRQRFIKKIYLDPTLKRGWPQKIEEDHVEGENAYYWIGLLVPVVSDINNDGYKEIIVSRAGDPSKILVYRHDGLLLWSVNLTTRCPGGNIVIPLIGDIDNDNYDEIITFDYNHYEPEQRMLAFNHDGSSLWSIDPGYLEGDIPSLLMSDLDSDGYKEIVLTGSDLDIERGIITIFNNNGKIIKKWYLPGSENCWLSVVGNFDEDTDLEIASICTSNSEESFYKGIIYVYNIDGSMVRGWPVYNNHGIFSFPIVGDINNDKSDNLIVGLEWFEQGFYSEEELGGLFVFNKTGGILTGWPAQKTRKFSSSPALGDIDSDGNLEISASRLGFETYLFNSTGEVISGWPQETVYNDWRSTIIGDINNDGSLDILTTSGGIYHSGGVYAWNSNGSSIEGFPKITEIDAQSAAIITDIDGDKKLELIASSDYDSDIITKRWKLRGSIYVWELDGVYDETKLPWPMFMHDPQHTGCYDCEETQPKPFIKSMLNNTGTKTISGRLLMKVQKKINGNWQDVKTVVDKQVSIEPSKCVALDKEWQTGGYFTPQEAGTYRINAFLLNSSGEITETSEGNLESSYEFKVV